MSEHDRLNAANTKAAQAVGWPELTGSPAQLGWAHTVRANKMREFDADAVTLPDSDRERFREVLLRETTAGVWIDSRTLPWQAMLVTHLTDEERAALFVGQPEHP